MKCGFARKDITPGFPVPMAGYQANRISRGVHDRLYVRALYFEGAEEGPAVILQADLLGLDRVCLEKIYGALNGDFPGAALNVPLPRLDKNKLLVCAVHTHSGFGGIYDTENGINRELIPLLGESSPALVDLVVRACVEAVAEAAGNCAETTVRINRGTVKGLGANRRRAGIPCDTSLFTVEFHRLDRKRILLYNLCCHPTVLNAENLLLSADFPGAVAEKLEESPGAYDMVAFINGSAGDMSTRFTRRESGFAECERFATIVIDALESTCKGEFLPLEKIELRYHPFSLLLTKTPDYEEAKANLQKALQNLTDMKNQNADPASLRKAESLVEGAQIGVIKSRSRESTANGSPCGSPPAGKTIEAGILRINTTTVVCSPFELFSSLALTLKEKKNVECFGYVNNLEGYLADCDAWDNLDYEALFGYFARGEGERYIELVSALL